jgi:hypothetical protein
VLMAAQCWTLDIVQWVYCSSDSGFPPIVPTLFNIRFRIPSNLFMASNIRLWMELNGLKVFPNLSPDEFIGAIVA